jgi:hypothetical protein
MKYGELTPEQLNALLNTYDDNTAFDALVDTIGLTTKRSTLRRKLREARQTRDILMKQHAANIRIPTLNHTLYNNPLIIDTDNAIVCGDIEIPDHDTDFLKLIYLTGMARGIRTLVINGDLVATDQPSLNSWAMTWASKQSTYEDDVDVVRVLLHELGQWFTDGIYIVSGNHDERIARTTGGAVHLGMLIYNAPAKYDQHAYMYLRTSRGMVKCVHPKNFSSDPVRLGQELYDVEQGALYDHRKPRETMQKCHFIVSHCHRAQWGFSKDGAYEIHAIGTARNPDKTKYLKQHTTKHRQWNQSFVAIQDGYIDHLAVNATNWRRELGDLYEQSPMANDTNGIVTKNTA